MTFNASQITTLLGNLSSEALRLGIFQQVLTHEPKSSPIPDDTLAIWWADVKPSNRFSGLDATAGVVTFQHRIYIDFLSQPEDSIDTRILTDVSALMNGYTGGFTFNSSVIAVDLKGIESQGLAAAARYTEIGGAWYRIADLSVPIIINDLWTQGA